MYRHIDWPCGFSSRISQKAAQFPLFFSGNIICFSFYFIKSILVWIGNVNLCFDYAFLTEIWWFLFLLLFLSFIKDKYSSNFNAGFSGHHWMYSLKLYWYLYLSISHLFNIQLGKIQKKINFSFKYLKTALRKPGKSCYRNNQLISPTI